MQEYAWFLNNCCTAFPAQEESSHEVATHQTGEGKHPAHEEVLRGRGFDSHHGEERDLDE